MTIARVMLQEADFARLVRGEVVTLGLLSGDTIELHLADIGWDRMYFQIERAKRDADGAEI